MSKLKAKGVGAGGESQGSDGLDGAKSKSAGRSVPPGGEKKKKSGDKKKEERAKALVSPRACGAGGVPACRGRKDMVRSEYR